MAHVDPAKRAIARELDERCPTPDGAETGAQAPSRGAGGPQ